VEAEEEVVQEGRAVNNSSMQRRPNPSPMDSPKPQLPLAATRMRSSLMRKRMVPAWMASEGSQCRRDRPKSRLP
jgi:hypothetical protein